jgi:hypothetical protein
LCDLARQTTGGQAVELGLQHTRLQPAACTG